MRLKLLVLTRMLAGHILAMRMWNMILHLEINEARVGVDRDRFAEPSQEDSGRGYCYLAVLHCPGHKHEHIAAVTEVALLGHGSC